MWWSIDWIKIPYPNAVAELLFDYVTDIDNTDEWWRWNEGNHQYEINDDQDDKTEDEDDEEEHNWVCKFRNCFE